jgi:serine/threonine protein phosphatase PrpC|uniref:PPM-type phosphatase domain-containing protein n=1 Tax=viral metagenome TaxID=1070528 RepID=A0A6C0ITC8_9ZZZZ
MKIDSYSLQGLRNSNEDQHVYFMNLDGEEKSVPNINFIGVFDGHGGKTVSSFLKKQVPRHFAKNKDTTIFTNTQTASKYLNKVFNDIAEKLEQKHPRAVNYTGSTALCGLISKKPNDKKVLWIANVGDSRAVLCNHKNEASQLSIDHKPNSLPEKKRIEQLGGKIKYDGCDWRINDLSLSRAFGDLESKPYITHLPQIFKYNINKGDKYIIFACDGLWDVLSNKKVVNYVNDLIEKKYTGNIAKKIAEKAIKEGSTDNVTVVALFLN